MQSPRYKLFRKPIPPMCQLEWMMLRNVKFGFTDKSTEPGVLEKLWHTEYITRSKQQMKAELLHSKEYEVGEMYGPSRSSAKSPISSYLADPCHVSLKPACASQAQTFFPSVHLANAFTKPLSSVPMLVIAVFGKRKVTLRFLASVDRSNWHKAIFLSWHRHRKGTPVQGVRVKI